MTTVTVYRFRKYDIVSDQMQVSRRMATREAIQSIAQAEVLEETALEIDAGEVGAEISGMTRIGFVPSVLGASGFQTQVR
jgi:hypothetical protein